MSVFSMVVFSIIGLKNIELGYLKDHTTFKNKSLVNFFIDLFIKIVYKQVLQDNKYMISILLLIVHESVAQNKFHIEHGLLKEFEKSWTIYNSLIIII